MTFLASGLTFSAPSTRATEHLALQTYDIPLPAADEVQLRLLVAPVNPLDLLTLAAKYPVKPRNAIAEQSVPGYDGVAVIEQVGTDVKELQVGDFVLPSTHGFGTWRTHAIAKPSELCKIPAHTRREIGGVLKMSAAVAALLLEDQQPALRKDDWVILNAGRSTMAQIFVQLAKEKGVHTVCVVRDRTQAELSSVKARLTSLGADIVVGESQLASLDLSANAPVLALDCVFGAAGEAVAAKLAPGGTFINYGMLSASPSMSITTATIFFNQITYKPFRSSKHFLARGAAGQQELLSRLVEV